MNEKDKEQLKQDVIAAGRGPFVGWWANLFEISPESLRQVHDYLSIAENQGPIDERLRHLIWVVVDSVVTHLYPRGAGVHARIAMELGASREDVIEALQIAAYVSSQGYEIGLPIIVEAARELGLPTPAGPSDEGSDWEALSKVVSPQAHAALTGLSGAGNRRNGFDAKTRELLLFAGYACPAMTNTVGMRRHARRALQAGASSDELIQALRLANCIGLHAIAEGINGAADVLKAA